MVETVADGATAQLRRLVDAADYERARRIHCELLRIAAKFAQKHDFKIVVVDGEVMGDGNLDGLVRKIFEVIDTYYIDWQADAIKEQIQSHNRTALNLRLE